MKKNNKGFTLIELLVVVAIIGILAAVGTVAYNGYTTAAKNAAIKAQFKMIVKYFGAELQKCNLGEDKIFNQQVSCSSRFTRMPFGVDDGRCFGANLIFDQCCQWRITNAHILCTYILCTYILCTYILCTYIIFLPMVVCNGGMLSTSDKLTDPLIACRAE